MDHTTTNQTVSELAGRLTLSVEETASILRLGRSATYEALHRGEIPYVKVGRRYLVPVPRLMAMFGAVNGV